MTEPPSNFPEITVLYFAGASTATGLTTEQVPLPASPDTHTSTFVADPPSRIRFPLSALAALLAARHPSTGLADVLAHSSWAVNEEMVDDPEKVFLSGGEEVAVICPVSGG
ncbi:hypothetical protein IEO21_04357 [Rhodonia placenta]|uniref:Molybdopterin synthase sulfur carrier subunit n=1 Tax=Rhodonia placenta TaxID=104341 RepID=A0A8H7P452_9APHY|nr:hypothetical protein IEO21_04357 [Postia placenta]